MDRLRPQVGVSIISAGILIPGMDRLCPLFEVSIVSQVFLLRGWTVCVSWSGFLLLDPGSDSGPGRLGGDLKWAGGH